jgi:hypothetical protein
MAHALSWSVVLVFERGLLDADWVETVALRADPGCPREHDGFVISALDEPLPRSDKAPMKTSSARERIHISICIID